MSGRVWAVFTALLAIVVLGDALARDSQGKAYVDPGILAAVALLVVTASYAWFNHQMATATRAAVEGSAAMDLARQREIQIRAIKPLAIELPTHAASGGVPLAVVKIRCDEDHPLLHLTVILRGEGASPEPGSTDGKWADSAGLGSWAGPRRDASGLTYPTAYIDLRRFLRPGGLEAYASPWEVLVTYMGTLGQEVQERYEWWFNDITTKPLMGWQMRGLRIQFPTLAGARPLDLKFGDD